jgi:hypothetical protein
MPADSSYGLHSLADQRYYHFVAIRGATLTPTSYWRKFEDLRDPANSLDMSDARANVQHRKLVSKTSYARGAVAVKLSAKNDGRPPYYYDLFAMRADVGGSPLLLLGFPFASLALDVFKSLVGTREILGNGQFVSANVKGLVSTMEAGFPRRFDGLNVHVVGVQFSVSDDKHLSNIRLGGDDPLAAEVYQKFLKSRLLRDVVLPDRCALACERLWTPERSDRQPSGLLRSRVHFDNNGNFKVYAQSGCGNLIVLPYALGQLHSAGLLDDVRANPLLRMQDDSQD